MAPDYEYSLTVKHPDGEEIVLCCPFVMGTIQTTDESLTVHGTIELEGEHHALAIHASPQVIIFTNESEETFSKIVFDRQTKQGHFRSHHDPVLPTLQKMVKLVHFIYDKSSFMIEYEMLSGSQPESQNKIEVYIRD